LSPQQQLLAVLLDKTCLEPSLSGLFAVFSCEPVAGSLAQQFVVATTLVGFVLFASIGVPPLKLGDRAI
jgi:predicted cobalt transporter CbtA